MALKALGVRLVLDDFGTGYSSLSYLTRLPLDALKVDRSFVDGLGTESRDTAVTEAIVAMSRALSLRVVGEGAETEQQVAELARLGCDLVQGFHFSRPVPAAEITRMLAEGPAWLAARAPRARRPSAVTDRPRCPAAAATRSRSRTPRPRSGSGPQRGRVVGRDHLQAVRRCVQPAARAAPVRDAQAERGRLPRLQRERRERQMAEEVVGGVLRGGRQRRAVLGQELDARDSRPWQQAPDPVFLSAKPSSPWPVAPWPPR